jgi:hypothetical protein
VLADGNRVPNTEPGNSNPDGSSGLTIVTPGMAKPDSGADATVTSGPAMATGTVTAQDCAGCLFPPPGAPSCNSAPPINIVYPADTVILPPNMNVLSIQWTPYGGGYQRFSVNFSAPPNTDWHILTSCANETTDMQAQGNPTTGGCELAIDPVSWSKLVQVNRDGGPITVTVSGTTDGRCASVSNAIQVNVAKEDLLGTYYYWKSTVTSQGVGGQIWMKTFGDLNMTEQDVTSNVATASGTLMASCNGCHALSRDGSRMVVYSDDSDSDDEYADVGGSLLDMTTLQDGGQAVQIGDSGLNGGGIAGLGGGQPPGFSTLHPNASSYITSNGLPQTTAGSPGYPTNGGYPVNVPANAFTIWDGNGNFTGSFAVGASADRPTMPDWSIDGTSVVYVLPNSVATYDQGAPTGTRTDDDHIFGGSLYTMPYSGNGMFGAPAVFLQSNGENNYYPSYSPDSTASEAGLVPPTFVLFNRVANNAGAGTNCNNGFCPNDSFSNPDARLMLMRNLANATPIDLEKANDSPASSPTSLSNSYPRWAPFVQTYHGNKILWFTFSSTRDYGLRILNHKSGMYQCYPADAAETPGGAHLMPFDPMCQEPQIWMAPILFNESHAATADPSGVAFWVPYQDMTTHNHTAQWTWTPNPPPPPAPDGAPPPCMCSHVYGACGAANSCGCCSGEQLKCSGSSQCISIAN